MRFSKLCVLILIVCFLVFSMAANASSKLNVVQLPFSDNIPSFVPYYWQTQLILAQGTLFEGLFGYAPDPKGLGGVKVVPVIADKWTSSENGKVWTITLRKDKKWSNGDPVTARDFEWTYRYEIDPKLPDVPLWASPLQHVRNGWNCKAGVTPISEFGVKALDDYTLQFTLSNPRSDFNCWLVVAAAMPLHRKTVEKWGPNEWWKPNHFVGNGPYIPISWQDHKEAVLIKNKKYVGTCGNVDKIVLKNFVAGSSQIQAYQAGEIDLAWVGSIADYKYVIKNPQLKQVYHETPADLTWSGYQVTRGFSSVLDNVKLRQAFALAVDRKTLSETVQNGRTFPCAKYWGDEDAIGARMTSIPYDIALAKKLMAEAGYPNGKGLPQLKFYITGNMPEVEYIVDQWKKNLGINVQIENLENAVYWNQYVWSDWCPDAEPGFVRITAQMNSFETWSLDKAAYQIIWTLGFPANIRKKAYDLEQQRISFLKKEGGLDAADWEPLLASKAKIMDDLKDIAAKEPNKEWVEELCGSKPSFNEQFDELYDNWKHAKTDEEKTKAWRLENRHILSKERDIMQYNARSEALKEAYRIRLNTQRVPFNKAIAMMPKCEQILQDQYYMVPLFMEKYQYVLRPRIKGCNIYKFSCGPQVFNFKYLNVK
jgi:ABC-type oligopeptide transport system substrate-binding subunit